MIEEELSFSDYEILSSSKSRIDKGKRIHVLVGMKCPSCKKEINAIHHGEKRICPFCGLQMWRYGNGLTCVKKEDSR